MIRAWLLILALAGLAWPAAGPARAGGGAAPEPADAGARYRAFATAYLQAYYERHPVRSTALGIHDHDGRLRDMRRAAIRRRTADLRRWLKDLNAIPREALSADEALDQQILDHAIRAELLELEEVRGWRRDPMQYNRLIADGIASLIDRDFAPLERRLPRLIERLEGIPAITAAARDNLRDVPRLWCELAVHSGEGTLKFLRGDVPLALEEQGFASLPASLRRRFRKAQARALERMERFVTWLREELLPRARGDFRLGPELFERKLRLEEHVALSVEELRRLNEEAIREYRSWIEGVASQIDPQRPAAEVIHEVASRYPSPDELIPAAERFVEQGRDFVARHEIVTLPTTRLPIVRPTPRYARSGFASMSTPGPFESVATEAYYNITNVDPDWSAEQQHEHLSYFNYPGLLGISVHEVMPGHFVQLLYRERIQSDVRKVFMPASLVEGWAHYAEQMMVDEGLGGGDPAVRVGQLRRALQRHARWYAGLEMHAFGASVDEACKRFEEIAFFAPFPARRETQRGSYNPTYLYYALGRMMILELREDYRRMLEARGEPFSLREFHDRLLGLGLPLPLARQVLLEGGDPGRAAD